MAAGRLSGAPPLPAYTHASFAHRAWSAPERSVCSRLASLVGWRGPLGRALESFRECLRNWGHHRASSASSVARGTHITHHASHDDARRVAAAVRPSARIEGSPPSTCIAFVLSLVLSLSRSLSSAHDAPERHRRRHHVVITSSAAHDQYMMRQSDTVIITTSSSRHQQHMNQYTMRQSDTVATTTSSSRRHPHMLST